MKPSGYVLATPVRDERPILERLVANVVSLEPSPCVWVVVDDGSTDGSREFLEERAAEIPWMVCARSPEAADEYLGAHVARIKRWVLERALEVARERGLDVGYAGVLDADLALPRDHYQRLIAAFEDDPRLGITSSLIVSRSSEGELTERFQRDDLPRGGTQFFRLECLQAIGGLPPWPGFDGAANVKAQSLGWKTALAPHVVSVQERETATRFGHAAGYARKGRYAWFLGVHPLLVVARTAAYMAFPPRSAGVHFFKGWLGEAVAGRPRCPDPVVREHYGRKRLIRSLRAVVAGGSRFVSRRPMR